MHTLVFDIGKTNKKVTLFDASLEVVRDEARAFEEIADDDDFPCDDLDAICAWIDDRVAAYCAEFEVTAINFSTYGATLVYLDADGAPVTPLYNYLKPLPEGLLRDVYRANGGAAHLHVVTGSPPLGMLNAGVQVLWLKRCKPTAYARVRYALHLPQYFSYRLTGEVVSEYTSVGCHTMLWDFGRRGYHAWTARAGVRRLLPGVVPADTHYPVELHGRSVRVGVGVHDSSAALLPYLAEQVGPFTLLSTGTWSVALNPENAAPLTAYELGQDCLTFMRPDGRAVKASRLFLGYEHAVRVVELARHYEVHPDTYQLIDYRADLDPEGAPARFAWEHLHPALPRGSGDHLRDPDFMTAYHRLMRELVELQAGQLRLVSPRRGPARVLIDGGFARSGIFVDMLRRSLPATEFRPTSSPNGSSRGAAMLVAGGLSTP